VSDEHGGRLDLSLVISQATLVPGIGGRAFYGHVFENTMIVCIRGTAGDVHQRYVVDAGVGEKEERPRYFVGRRGYDIV
jgi:hypothetical protein